VNPSVQNKDYRLEVKLESMDMEKMKAKPDDAKLL
jgi:hypothetical protein